MYRSVSTTRLEGNESSSSSSSSSSILPMYEASSSSEVVMAKKEKGRVKFAENAVHLIPFVLLFCALLLWFVSDPDVELPTKGDSIAARIEGLTLEGDIDSDGTQRGSALQELDGDVLNSANRGRDYNNAIHSQNN